MEIELVSKESQLIENAKRLYSYRNGIHREFYVNLIARGATFVVVQVNDEFIFAPSRFVGYIDNSFEKYEYVSQKTDSGFDGRTTNQKISKLLGKDREDALLDEEYLRYCEKNEIAPNNKKRKYWPMIVENNRYIGDPLDLFDSSNIKPITKLSDIIKNITRVHNGLDSKMTDYYRNIIYKAEKIVALSMNDSYFFAPALYAAFTGYQGNNFMYLELDQDESEKIISGLLNQKFKKNHRLDERIFMYLKNTEKNFKYAMQREYCYIDLDESDYKSFEQSSETEENPTEKERNVNTRIGQIKFRSALISKWGECSVTGCKTIGLLRASHIKPWIDSNDYERLDVYNGLLLIPNLDLLFDKGYISFDTEGRILISKKLDEKTMKIMNVHDGMYVSLSYDHQRYMEYHREFIFKS